MGQQHYRFAYGFLKGFAFQRTEELREALWSGDGDGFLAWLWERSADEGSEPCPGLSVRTFTHAGRPAALVTLPEPAEPPEAYFVLILFGSDTPTYYSLEKTEPLWFGEGEEPSGTVLGLWEPDRRYNLGEGPPPDPDLFVARVLSLVDERSDGHS